MSIALDDCVIERAIAYTPRPGDVVVLEMPEGCTQEETSHLKQVAESKFGREVSVVVLAGVRFAGVVGAEEVDASFRELVSSRQLVHGLNQSEEADGD